MPRPLALVLFAFWAVVTSVGSSLVQARNLRAMPSPPLGRVEPPGRWTLFHVLSTECGCSGRILEHLGSSTRPQNVAEKVLVLGPAGLRISQLRSRGFDVELTRIEAIDHRLGTTALPALVIAAPDGRVVYAGGYTKAPRGRAIEDLTILAELRSQKSVAALPVYGCAVSAKRARRSEAVLVIAQD